MKNVKGLSKRKKVIDTDNKRWGEVKQGKGEINGREEDLTLGVEHTI